MTIVLTGGGSGGHITPLLVTASELKQQDTSLKLVYVGQKGDPFADIPRSDSNVDEVYTVRAGKFRRYYSEGLSQVFNVKTLYLNLRDALFVLIGIFQSILLMRKIRPDAVFSRGGYVSVPVCLAAKFAGSPYITHDSDPLPSLTNRIIGRWAKYNLVSSASGHYPYSPEKTINTGIPISQQFQQVTPSLRSKYRQKLNIEPKAKVLLVIGGGLGAQALNEVMAEILPNLMAEFSDLYIFHIVGRGKDQEVINAYEQSLTSDQRDRVEVIDFTNEVYLYSGAADVVVTRAGATNLAEFECQGVACIIVPSTYLVGGHQLINAQPLKDAGAALVISDKALEENPQALTKEIRNLLRDGKLRQKLADSIAKFAQPKAAEQISSLIIKTAKGQ